MSPKLPLDLSKWSVHRELSRCIPGLLRAEWWYLRNLKRPNPPVLNLGIKGYGLQEFREISEFVVTALAIRVSRGIWGVSPTRDELQRIILLTRELSHQLRAQYTKQEIDSCATGAWPGLKEVLLYLLLRRNPVDIVIETGVAQGVSSFFLLNALETNRKGRLISIDLPNRSPEGRLYPSGRRDPVYTKTGLEPGWLIPLNLRSRWELRLGPAQMLLPRLEVQPDLFLHDSLHTPDHMRFELDWAYDNVKRGGFIACDDINWNNAFADFVNKHSPGDLTLLCGTNVGLCFKGTSSDLRASLGQEFKC
jgi:hypothetical protein